jgi:uncharacterized protein YndB with AHSA1/START domain
VRTSCFCVLAISLLFSRSPAAQTADDASCFVQEVTIHAPPSSVWSVLTTSEGYKTLGVAEADVDFRIGGFIRSHYSSEGFIGDDETIENRILAYEPERMIATAISRPPKSFPFKQAWKSTWSVVTLTDLGNGETHVRAAMFGFGADEESSRMRKFFEAGNGSTLKLLRTRLESGVPLGEPKK